MIKILFGLVALMISVVGFFILVVFFGYLSNLIKRDGIFKTVCINRNDGWLDRKIGYGMEGFVLIVVFVVIGLVCWVGYIMGDIIFNYLNG